MKKIFSIVILTISFAIAKASPIITINPTTG